MKRKPKIHELKTWPEYFAAIVKGIKTFEVRKNDRRFKVGDKLLLREWEPEGFDPECEIHRYLMADGRCSCGEHGNYTGRQHRARITYITDFGQSDGQVVMAITALHR